MSDHLEEYLKHIVRVRPTWVVLGDVEKQPRTAVYDQMTCAYGDDWAGVFCTQYPDKRDLFTQLSELREKERMKFGCGASANVLDYAYIGDLEQLIFQEWNRYRFISGGAKTEWKNRFSFIIGVRNSVYHHRDIPGDVILDVEKECRLILSKLVTASKTPA